MNAKLFINYRREDTRHAAGRLYDRLIQRFGDDQVFMDIDQIDPGEDFVEVINRKVGTCDVAIVAIGPHWLGATDESGKRRLDDEEDFVRMEIVAALQRNILVVPVLVDGARMPRKRDLPEPLAPLSRRNAIELSETRFHADVNRLIEAVERSLTVLEKKAELSATPAAPPPEPAGVRPPEAESKVLPEPSESTKPAEAGERKEIDGDAPSGVAPASLAEIPEQIPTPAAQPYWVSERSQQDSVATAKDPTTPLKSTQTVPITRPVPSSSSIVALKESEGWTWEARIRDGAVVGAIVLLLFAIVGVLGWYHNQKAAKQGSQATIARVVANPQSVVANPQGLSEPAELKLFDQAELAQQADARARLEGVSPMQALQEIMAEQAKIAEDLADQANARHKRMKAVANDLKN
jgi:hypothetical protein